MSKASVMAWLVRGLIGALAALLLALLPAAAHAQIGSDRIAAQAVADGAPVPGEDWWIALHFTPSAPEWHGYWSNPGDAGLGMELDWTLPQGWQAGAPLYPLPRRLVIAGLMNHVYEGEYAVLVPVRVPRGAAVANPVPPTLDLKYLACTDQVCVPQQARLTIDPAKAARDPRMAGWRAALVPPLGSRAGFEVAGERIRIGFPLPAASQLGDPHVFIAEADLGAGRKVAFAAPQTFIREGDLLVAEVPLAAGTGAADPRQISGILDFGTGRGVRFAAQSQDVPLEGVKPLGGASAPPLWQLLLAALLGGLILNVMPCVFPILSLKALALAKAGGDERAARGDALAYSAGVVLATTGLGALVLALRAAGEQVGWAFQLQNPVILAGLFLLALAITANFAGLFAVPGLAIAGGAPSRTSSFATGLLAAFVATPCTGPFMALALGAALVVPPVEGLAIFALLGLGLALPFLALGFVPALRRRLPRPGAWMERFRRWMALPMALTALALAWLLWRGGGAVVLGYALGLGAALLAALAVTGRMQRTGSRATGAIVAALVVAGVGLALLPRGQAPAEASESLLDPAPYSEAALAAARASGKPVFVWFTADWCLSCKVNERVAIEREDTRAAFAKGGVIALRGDWTRPDPVISAALARHGAAGVPLYLWYAPGGEAEVLPQVLTPAMLTERAQAAPATGTAR